MGSRGLFHRYRCYECGDLSMANCTYKNGQIWCMDCLNAPTRLAQTTVFQYLGTCNIPVNIITPYLGPIDTAEVEFRRLYLRPLLLGPNTHPRQGFRLLTYGSNGMPGSISDTEDIIDRLLGFVCG